MSLIPAACISYQIQVYTGADPGGWRNKQGKLDYE